MDPLPFTSVLYQNKTVITGFKLVAPKGKRLTNYANIHGLEGGGGGGGANQPKAMSNPSLCHNFFAF